MTTIGELMAELQARDVTLRLDGEQLAYDAPAGTLTEADLARIGAHKTRIIQLLRSVETQDAIPIARVERGQSSLLALAQQRLWFLDQLEGTGAAYNIQGALRLRGVPDLAALQAALDGVVARHETLRTAFRASAGQALQVVAESAHLELEISDVSAHAPSARQDAVQRLAAIDVQRPFVLEDGALVRARLVRLGAHEHVLLVTLHHIVADGWSLGVFARDLATLYEAYVADEPSPLAPLPIQYVDYAEWQRRQSASAALQRQRDYWLAQLSGAPPLLELPTDRPRAAVQTYAGESLPIVLSPALSDALKALAHRYDATLFMVLYAGWAAFLSRLSGQPDVVVGVPVACRPRPELEDLVGFFVNTLALRVGLDDDPTVAALIARVKALTLDAYANQELPFAEVIEALRPARSLSRSPVFQVLFALQSARPGASRLGSTITFEETAEYVAGGIASARFDLTLTLEETGDQIAGALNYASDLFERTTVRRWLGLFENLLGDMAARPTARASTLLLVDDAERKRVVTLFNATAKAYPAGHTIHGLFEAQARGTPHDVAVMFEGATHTYAEVNGRANQLARHLQAAGVGHGALVAVCLERGLEMVVGLLGVLKAGAAYVPIDPTYPAARRQYVLDDVAAPVVLTQAALRSGLGETRARLVLLDSDWPAIGKHDPGPPKQPGGSPRDLAYVIYTSGSTGQPKGVMNEHRGVVNRLQWMQEAYRLEARDRVVQKTPFAFDVSVWEIFWPLLNGACLVVARPRGHQDPLYLARLIQESGVTTVHFVPSMLAAFLNEPGSRACTSLRRVVCSGEELSPGLRARCLEQLPTAGLFNLYGPTEAAIDVTHWDCRREHGPGRVPIGWPIANTQIYVLDAARQPVPVGVPGEIYIGGIGVARGYLGRPALTDERFVPDELGGAPGERLYRTGDIGRWRGDGALEYLGRNDDQIKIRGFRVELGEIDARLTRHAQVKEALTVARQDHPTPQRLVTYLTCREPAPSVEALRTFAAEALPEYMVPAAFVILESLPLTPNGKVDRRALPVPDIGAQLRDQYVAPRGSVETTLCQIWAEVLGLARVGVDDDYFALGGDSILSLRVLDKARAAGLTFTVEDIFRQPTIARLAQAILTGHTTPAVRPTGGPFSLLSDRERAQFEADSDIEDAYPLSALQAGMYFHSELNRDSAVYHDIFSLCIDGPFQPRFFERAVQALTQRHPVLRSSFHTSADNRLVQALHRSVDVQVAVLDAWRPLEVEQEEVVAHWIDQEKRRRFAWAEPPLFRVVVHTRGRDRFQYSLSFHHAILDGWSLASLQTELFEHYLNLLDGKDVAPARPASLYRDYIALEQQALQSSESREFWREALADVHVLPLPVSDEARQERRGLAVATYDTAFTPELYRQLTARARTLGVALKTLLLAAHVKVLSLWSGQHDVLTGLVSNGRLEERDGDRALGLFLNSLPLRARLERGTWRELALSIHALEQALLPHRRYPLQAIQQFTGGDTLINTLFNFVHFHVYQRLFEAGMVKVPKARVFEQTNFDLMVVFSEDVTGAGVSLSLAYDPAVFDHGQMRRMSYYYQAALQALATRVDESHDAVTLLTTEEHRQLARWNATQADYPRQRLLHELVEEQVRRSPAAVALHHDDVRWTYAELEGRANCLARYLRARGVGPERLVALSMHRRAELVVGLLGVLKAGGAYVALDPSYPRERLDYMLADAQPCMVLTHADLAVNFAGCPVPVVALDTDWPVIATGDDAPLVAGELGLTQQSLAYVIYTSGSTGRPKGVMIEHASVVNFVEWGRRTFTSEELRHTLFSTSINFDLSVFELFVPLSVGATVHLVQNALDACEITEGLTLINTVPSALAAMLEARRVPRSLRVINLAGEALKRELVEAIYAQTDVDCVANLYGPTETTTYSTWVRMARSFEGAPHIGAPIANTYVRLLDAHGQLVPVGVPGEIHIGGVGVTRGYLRRPELTAARFVADPSSDEPAARLYRTGDLGVWRPDGNLEYLGRADQQVKIRGFRIELGEIEAQLRAHPRVREAVVLAQEHETLGVQLVAYVQHKEERALDVPVERLQVEAWRAVFDGEYEPRGAVLDARDDFSVWVSSYDGTPLPFDEMRTWAELATGRISALPTRRVLEIGCGVGLILLRLLPNCDSYVGTDFSQDGLDALAAHLPADLAGRVRLLRCDAADPAALDGQEFDTTILNSVVQYFPSVEYLRDVLQAAVARTAPGGAVFIGDVRSLGLLETFASAVVVRQGQPDDDLEALRQRMKTQVDNEGELLLSPHCFVALLAQLPRVSHLEILPKIAAPYSNELFDYRYDVIMHVESSTDAGALPPRLDWPLDGLTVDLLRTFLQDERPERLRVSNVPSARLESALELHRCLLQRDALGPDVTGWLQILAAEPTRAPRFDALLELGEVLGYQVEASWLEGGEHGAYTLVLSRADLPRHITAVADLPTPRGDLRDYANDPLVNRRRAQLLPALKAHVRQGLPEHMHPARYVILETLPLTPNGKLDRKALAAIEPASSTREDHGDLDDAPRGDIEQALAAIWQELLGRERVSRYDNFFDLGGHSLLAVQVTYRIYVLLGWEVELWVLFEFPTVHELARQFHAGGAATRAPIERVERGKPLRLSSAQRRLWTATQVPGAESLYQVAHAVRLLGALDRVALQAALDALLARHEPLRTVYQLLDGEAKQVILPEARFALEVVDLAPLTDAEREAQILRHAADEARAPFDLERGPVIRGRLLRLGEHQHVFLFTVHAIVYDGWSRGVLLRELGALYTASRDGQPASLPALEIHYADYAEWQNAWLHKVLDGGLQHWRQHLEGAPAHLTLPTDRARPAQRSFAGAGLRFTLKEELSAGLKALASSQDATLFMVLFAGWALTLARLACQDDVVIGTLVANREVAEVENLVGAFVNHLPMRARLPGEASLLDVLGEVKRTARAAYANQWVPFLDIVDAIQPPLDSGHHPLFQVTVMLENTPASALRLPGITFAPQELPLFSAEFDLALSLKERGSGIDGLLIYPTELFDTVTIAGWVAYFEAVLLVMVADTGTRVADLPAPDSVRGLPLGGGLA